jgi:hypothetical protein
MTEQAGGNTNVGRVVDCDAGGGAIAKQVRIDRLPQSFTRAGDNTVIDRIVGHRWSVHRQPKCVAADAGAAQRYDARPMICEISHEVRQ